jgi:hypothetical protein
VKSKGFVLAMLLPFLEDFCTLKVSDELEASFNQLTDFLLSFGNFLDVSSSP